MAKRGLFVANAARLAEASDALAQMDGLIYYRVHGEGFQDGFTGKRVLSDEERIKALEARKRIDAIRKSINEHASELSELARELDTFMRYS